MISSMLRTALNTPAPENRFGSPSRNSVASWAPVDAPEGTDALPTLPSARSTSASTVGRPRESKISRPRTRSIAMVGIFIEPSILTRQVTRMKIRSFTLVLVGPVMNWSSICLKKL